MDSRIRHAVTFMEQNLDSKVTENELAHRAALTAQHFPVLFKAATGEPPGHYFKRLRMEKARKLLEASESYHLSIKEIAARVGCRDVSHFVRDFEKRFGQSPKRYRESR